VPRHHANEPSVGEPADLRRRCRQAAIEGQGVEDRQLVEVCAEPSGGALGNPLRLDAPHRDELYPIRRVETLEFPALPVLPVLPVFPVFPVFPVIVWADRSGAGMIGLQRPSTGGQPMKTQPLVVTPNDYARGLNVVGEKITVLASNAVTHGYEIFLQQGVEGSGPPPHSHDWDEAFYVVKGQVEIHYGDKTVLAEPGTLVHLPAGTVHSFRFGAGGGEMISVTDARSRASQLFTNIDKEIAPGPPDVPKLIAVAHQNGVKVAV
jgi:quercetin dioxygenase-like cupin family protein